MINDRPGELAPLSLAYIGDAVFELLARGETLASGRQVDSLHGATLHMVNAAAQARMYHKIWPMLSEEERGVMRRGRNAKGLGRAKHATMTDYRHATGLEALFGFLYLRGDLDRLKQLFLACIKEDDVNG